MFFDCVACTKIAERNANAARAPKIHCWMNGTRGGLGRPRVALGSPDAKPLWTPNRPPATDDLLNAQA
jgi:hypothetical protein